MLYWLPAIAIVVAGAPAISNGWRTVVWTVALGIMGAACMVNALRCGRVHCYVTGPLLPSYGPRRIVVRFGHPASRPERLEPSRPNSLDRCHRPVVPARDVVGKISEGPRG